MGRTQSWVPRRVVLAAMLVAGATGLFASDRAPDLTAPLAWAYPSGAQTTYGQPLGAGPFHMTGSRLTLTRGQAAAMQRPIDWYPRDHPPAPAIVRGPTASKTTPCAECHGFNGAGFPGSADLAGLPADYIVRQVAAFRTGQRRSAKVGQPNTAEMIKVAMSVRPQELADAAAYFATLARRPWLRVVETDSVARTIPDRFGWLDRAPGGGREPIGDRIVELSDDMARAFLDDDHVVLTDYVPRGAVARGRRVVATGGGGGMPCATCHGAGLRGTALAPPLAARPAGYVARTLWDIRVGARGGPAVAPMRVPAMRLRPAEIRDVAAYLASLQP